MSSYPPYIDNSANLGNLNAVPSCRVCTVDGVEMDQQKTIIVKQDQRYNLTGVSGNTVNTEKSTVQSSSQWRG